MPEDVSESEPQFEHLIAGLRAADPVVLGEFVDRYGPALERLAVRRIETRLRRRIGPETIAQSVCRTFLRRAEGGEFEIADSDSLWGLLCAIALTKVREKVRHHRREKRAVDRETSAATAAAGALPDGRPSPEDEALFADQFAHVISTLTDEERTIVDLRLRGKRQVDIAAAIGVTERTVRRLMSSLEARLEAAFGADAGKK